MGGKAAHLPVDEESTRADASTDPSSEYQYFWWINTPDGGGPPLLGP